MSRLDDLPPDQRAALSLLLRQHKSYAEVAALLQIAETAVHDRAHAALAMLAPAQARGLTADERLAIGEYLLDAPGAGVAERLQARGLLASSEPARAWGQALAQELAPLGETAPLPPAAATADAATAAPGSAPAVDAPPAAAAPATPPPASSDPVGAGSPRTGPRPQASRTGGAVLLGLLAAGIIVGILFATGVLGGGSGKHRTTAGAGSKTGTGPTVDARLPLHDPNGSKTKAGLVQLLSEGEKRAFYVVAEGMAPTQGFFYALWLYNSPSRSVPLGKAPAVSSSKRLEGGGLLPTNAGAYHEILLTRETSTRASRPGTVVLRGPFKLSG